MPWVDAAQLETSMAELLDEFNWPEADELCEKLIFVLTIVAESRSPNPRPLIQ